jgi:very-short-patch-repair endonuclease
LNAAIELRGSWIEADCVWRRQRLIVELDGHASHGTGQAFERDRARDRALHAAGWRVLRVTWRQLHEDAEQIADDLRALLGSG